MELLKKENSKYWWYDFTIRGERFRGSTKETNESRARKLAALKFADAFENSDPLPRKSPTLRQVSGRFLKWVDLARLVSKSKTYYQDGWRLLATTPILGMRLDVINNDVAERLNFTGSAANTNCALRTLRRLLHKAEEWKLIRRAPKIKLLPEKERSLRLDDQAERKLLTGAAECNWRSGRGLIFHTSPIWCLIEEPPTMYPSVSNKILSLSRQSSQIMAETLSQEGKSGHDVL